MYRRFVYKDKLNRTEIEEAKTFLSTIPSFENETREELIKWYKKFIECDFNCDDLTQVSGFSHFGRINIMFFELIPQMEYLYFLIKNDTNLTSDQWRQILIDKDDPMQLKFNFADFILDDVLEDFEKEISKSLKLNQVNRIMRFIICVLNDENVSSNG